MTRVRTLSKIHDFLWVWSIFNDFVTYSNGPYFRRHMVILDSKSGVKTQKTFQNIVKTSIFVRNGTRIMCDCATPPETPFFSHKNFHVSLRPDRWPQIYPITWSIHISRGSKLDFSIGPAVFHIWATQDWNFRDFAIFWWFFVKFSAKNTSFFDRFLLLNRHIFVLAIFFRRFSKIYVSCGQKIFLPWKSDQNSTF